MWSRSPCPSATRKEDLPLLVQAFLKESAEENGKPHREFSPEAMACILNLHWLGNVRELRGAVEHAGGHVQFRPHRGARSSRLCASTNAPLLREDNRFQEADGLNLHQTERAFIFRALEESGGNRTEAAQSLGISCRTLHRRLKELHISKKPTSP